MQLSAEAVSYNGDGSVRVAYVFTHAGVPADPEVAIACYRRERGDLWEPLYGLKPSADARFSLPECFVLSRRALMALAALDAEVAL
jgi:hypothetical protein